MKLQHLIAFILALAALLLFLGWLTPSTIAQTEDISPAADLSQAEGVWLNYTPGDAYVNAIVAEGNELWVATNGGGVLRWDRSKKTFTRYNTTHGLVHNKVRSIAIDEVGHKWFGTEAGVSEFDGRSWKSYTTTHGLAHDKVLAIAIDRAGNKWFGSWGGGVSRFDGQTWTTYTRADGLADNLIHAIVPDNIGNLWFATPSGLSRFDGQKWTTLTTADGLVHNWVHAIAVDQTGILWFGTPGGLSRFDGQTWQNYTQADGLVYNNIRAIAVDRLNHKWIATSDGLSRFDEDKGIWFNYTLAGGLPRKHITSIAIDPEDGKWFGAIDGLVGLAGARWELLTAGKPVSSRVRAMAIGLDGHKWVGTNEGVSEFDGRTWAAYTTSDGLANNQVNAVAIDRLDQKWFGTAGGVSMFDGKNWNTYTSTHGLAHDFVSAVAIDPAGNKWFGTLGGVSMFDGRTWTTYNSAHGLINDNVTAMAIDPQGIKWFGTVGGLSRFDSLTWNSYTTTHGLPHDYISSLAVDRSGLVWAGFYNCCSDGAGKITFQPDTTITYEPVVAGFVLTITTDEQDRVWFGTFFDGMFRVEGGQVQQVGMDQGLVSNHVTAIAIDETGQPWVGTDTAGIGQWVKQADIFPAITPPPLAQARISLPALPEVHPQGYPSNPTVGPLPALLAQIPIVPGEQKLLSLQLDHTLNRLYLTDSINQLHILDLTTYESLAVIPETGKYALDPTNNRLFTFDEEKVTVREADSLKVAGIISPTGQFILDQARDRFFIADRIYDTNTLEQMGQLPQTYDRASVGWLSPDQLQDYNPLRDEFYMSVGGTSGVDIVYIIDNQTSQMSGDLLPDISANQPHNLSSDPAVYPEQNLIVVTHNLHVAGHGAGSRYPLRFFDATTLDEFPLDQSPSYEIGCSREIVFTAPLKGRVYRDEYSSSYYTFNNLIVYDLNGNRITWRDDLYLGRINPATEQMYLGRTVYELNTLTPIGQLPVSEAQVCTIDARTGLIYALYEGDLVVMTERGGWPPPPLPPLPTASLPPIGFIEFSPAYAQDRTLFAYASQNLYRSTDGGATWAQLRGGLTEYLSLYPGELQISPDFIHDRTLFVTGPGVYRSTDGGDTWQPMWRDLLHLNVSSLALSPNYALDKTVLAYAKYVDLAGSNGGTSAFKSVDGGLHWTLAITAPSEDLEDITQASAHLLPTTSSSTSIYFRQTFYGQVERTLDAGNSWELLKITETDQYFRSVLISPAFSADHTVFAITENQLFRSNNKGDTWEALSLPFENDVRTPLFSPNFGIDRTLYMRTSGHLMRSTDGGDTWEILSLLGEEIPEIQAVLFSPDFGVDNTFYMFAKERLLRSTDRGDTWAVLTLPEGIEGYTPLRIQLSPNFATDQTIYFYIYDGLFRSIDGGHTWERGPAGLEEGDRVAGFEFSPPLDDGSYDLFIWTELGKFFKLPSFK